MALEQFIDCENLIMLNQNNPNVWKQENYKILYDVLLGLHIHDKNVKYVNSLKYVSMNVRENVRTEASLSKLFHVFLS